MHIIFKNSYLEENVMEIKVNEQTQRFSLAFDKWIPAVGHEIKVG